MIIFVVLVVEFIPFFRNNYYSISHYCVLLLVLSKVTIDWLSHEISISLSAQLVIMLGTINEMNMKILPVFLYEIGYFG